ncbi:hypothetical protein GCM10025873_13340 [Demequina sediminis]|uniref:hypothetical protein n=1 Tax=Demequina sediminis TaxID=1930058 RepID=UPI002572C10A|nr:hypothetical protein [Demequina sediminis]BDZ61543.1 hypothetical protein GCM10025873_13340 [Demequina sediminis]
MTDITPNHTPNTIKCPNCGTLFTIDEAQYADIVQQVRTAEFEGELHARLAAAEKAKETEIALAVASAQQQAQQTSATKDTEIQQLKGELKAAAANQELAVAKALSAAEKGLLEAKSKLELQAAEQKVRKLRSRSRTPWNSP